jgi:hypothetical protein
MAAGKSKGLVEKTNNGNTELLAIIKLVSSIQSNLNN